MQGIVAYHVILTAYGFWLPNDPRGSWSKSVRSPDLFRVGGAVTPAGTRRSVAARPHDRLKRLAGKAALKREPVRFTGEQARAIVQGFGRRAKHGGAMIYALAIMPDHCHLLLSPPPIEITRFITQLKGAGTLSLKQAGLLPEAEQPGRTPPVWARRAWKVFCYSSQDVARCTRYINNNPIKAGLPRQTWRCITPYRERHNPS